MDENEVEFYAARFVHAVYDYMNGRNSLTQDMIDVWNNNSPVRDYLEERDFDGRVDELVAAIEEPVDELSQYMQDTIEILRTKVENGWMDFFSVSPLDEFSESLEVKAPPKPLEIQLTENQKLSVTMPRIELRPTIPDGAKEVIDGWYSLGQIGQGSFGTVLKVTDGRRYAAAKIYKTNVERGKTAQQAFDNETSILDQLDHPNIPKLILRGEVPDEYDAARVRPTIVMELVEGQTLEDVIGEGKPMQEDEVIEITKQLLETIHYAHNKTGKVHSDLGPQNAMLDAYGKIKVTDFGMAREPTEGLQTAVLSQVTENKHRIEYIASEVFMGDSVVQTDLYSVAQIARALLKGEHVDRNIEEGELEGIGHYGLRNFIEKNTNGRWSERSSDAEDAWREIEFSNELVKPENKDVVVKKDGFVEYLLPAISKTEGVAMASCAMGGGGLGIGMVAGFVGLFSGPSPETLAYFVGFPAVGFYVTQLASGTAARTVLTIYDLKTRLFNGLDRELRGEE